MARTEGPEDRLVISYVPSTHPRRRITDDVPTLECGEATPARHVLRPDLYHRVGVHTVLDLRRVLPPRRRAHRDPHNPGTPGVARARLPDDPLAREVVLVPGRHRTPARRPRPHRGPQRHPRGKRPHVGPVWLSDLRPPGVRGAPRQPRGRALGEEPGWRGFALPGLQGSGLSPLVSTLILGVLVSGWHAPILFLEEGGLHPQIVVGYLLGSVAVTFWYSWIFNHTGGSVLITLVSHATQGTITIGGWG